MKKELAFIASTFRVPLPKTGEDAFFSELDLWQLLNLPAKTILDMPDRLHEQFGITPAYLDEVLYDYLVQSRGKQAIETEWQMPDSPSYFISATKHYSWPKGAGTVHPPNPVAKKFILSCSHCRVGGRIHARGSGRP